MVQPCHEHRWVHDRHVKLGVKQVVIDGYQIVHASLPAERNEIVIVWIAYLDPSGRGDVLPQLTASPKRGYVCPRPSLRGPALELGSPKHIGQLVKQKRRYDEHESAVAPCRDETTRPSLGITDERRDENARIYDGTGQARLCARRAARTSATARSSAASGERVPCARASSRARRPKNTESASSTT